MFLSSTSRSLMAFPLMIDEPGRDAAWSLPSLSSAQALGRQTGDRLVIVRRHITRAGVDIDRRQTIDDLLAEAEDRQIALLERLLIRGQLNPTAIEGLDDLRAGVET